MPCRGLSFASISEFPNLNLKEFQLCCLYTKEELLRYEGRHFESVEVREEAGQCYLIIKKHLDTLSSSMPKKQSLGFIHDSEEDLEEDETQIAKCSPCSRVLIEYFIVLSPTYQVPVLYFMSEGLQTLQSVYENLVPKAYHVELNHSSIIGAISFGENPVNGLSMFFTHPCNTAHAMYEIGSKMAGTTRKYLIIWMGVVAKCVGLYIPFDDNGN